MCSLHSLRLAAHTTAVRGSRWEVSIPKRYLDDEGAFDVQRISTVASVKMERKPGELTREELDLILDRLAERFGI